VLNPGLTSSLRYTDTQGLVTQFSVQTDTVTATTNLTVTPTLAPLTGRHLWDQQDNNTIAVDSGFQNLYTGPTAKLIAQRGPSVEGHFVLAIVEAAQELGAAFYRVVSLWVARGWP
jgi:hypothetical protein